MAGSAFCADVCGPSRWLAVVEVDNSGDVQPAFSGAELSNVCGSNTLTANGIEAALHNIGRAGIRTHSTGLRLAIRCS